MATHVLIIALATGASLAILLLAVGLAQLAMAAQQNPSPGTAWGWGPRVTLDGPEAKAPPSLWWTVLVPSWSRLRRRIIRYLPGNAITTYNARIAGAGNPYRLTGGQFLLLKLVMLLFSLACGVAAGDLLALYGQRQVRPVALSFALFLGFLLPDAWLSARRRARVAEVHRLLPSTIDLLVVAIEAGLTFDKAVAYAVTTMQGALVSELSYYLVQRRLGSSVGAALGLVAQRVRDRDVDRLTALVAQSHQYGLPVGRVLSAFAMDLRTRRRQEATQRAQAAVVKMLVPMVLFILPAIFIIVLGPALAHLTGALGRQ
jgi:tight adherence protein C